MMYRMLLPQLSAAERPEFWVQSKQGERLSDIAMALGHAPGTVHARIQKTGGFPQRPCKRAGQALTTDGPGLISRGLAEGLGMGAIARALGRGKRNPEFPGSRHLNVPTPGATPRVRDARRGGVARHAAFP
jgi:hypothetical protein